MAEVLDVERHLEPWRDATFRADLAAYAEGEAETARRYAKDARLLARMASLVPRAAWDTRGATAWTSFLGELAVARRSSTQLAATVVADAQQLVRLMPHTLALLEQGLLVVPRARALLEAARPCEDDLVRTIDRELADRARDLPPSRIRSAVDRLALQHDVDVAAARAATASAGRGTRRTPLPDGQSELALVGPALVLAQAQAALEADARAWLAALRGTGDTRGVDQLRFDLGVHRLLGRHAPVVPGPVGTPGRTGEAPAAGGAAPAGSGVAPASPVAPSSGGPADSGSSAPPSEAPAPGDGPDDLGCALPDPTSPSWWTDRRFSRPVRLDIAVPVTTALGLSDEPGWLPGYGWISAPQVRQLLPVAELRQACVVADGPARGQLVDLAERVVRPGSAPEEARAALLDMVVRPFEITDKTWRTEPRHDPSPSLAEFVKRRDRHSDGPVDARPLRAEDADLDHDKPYRGGPDDLVRLDATGSGTPAQQSQPQSRSHSQPQSQSQSQSQPQPQPQPQPQSQSQSQPESQAQVPAAQDTRAGRSWLVNGSVAWASHGDTGFDLDPESGLLTLVDLGHEDVQALGQPLADGPTAAWNLVGRGRRAHGLKHRGWTPLRTATSTLWFTPAGQTVEVPHDLSPVGPPTPGRPLPGAQWLHDREAASLASAACLEALLTEPEVGEPSTEPFAQPAAGALVLGTVGGGARPSSPAPPADWRGEDDPPPF